MRELNVIEFAESGLGMVSGIKLYPIQQTLLKIIFGVPLDFQPQTIEVWDDLHETKLYTLSEYDYLSMCFDEMKCNYGDWRMLPAEGFNEAHLFQGSRGGKSTLLMVSIAYKLYRTLLLGDPQRFFNLCPGSVIDLSLVGMDSSGVRRMHESLHDYYINRTEIFAPYLAAYNPGRSIGFFTEADRLRKNRYPSVNIGAYPCTANVRRGPASIGLFYDEFAHYTKADDLYCASTPATMNYRNESGDHSLIMSVSSPWHTNGKMFDLHDMAFSLRSIFTHNETTATLNPGAPYMHLRQQKEKGNKYFDCEFGGKFLHGSKTMTLKEYREDIGKGSL